jgi:hypothetical protein
VQHIGGIQRPQHFSLAPAELVVALHDIASDVNAAYDWARRIAQRIKDVNAAVHARLA